jgi:hypothetical protein
MSIDERGRAAAAELRRATAGGTDPASMLKALHRRRRNRTVGSVAVAVAACVAVAIGLLVAHGQTSNRGSQPATQHSTHQRHSTHQTTPPGKRCGAYVTCLGGRRFVVNLRVPVTLTLPTNFNRKMNVAGPHNLEAYISHPFGTGVSVEENAVPVKYDGSWTRDPAAGNTAESVAHWLSTRPFLTDTTLNRVSVGNLSGWRVTGDLKRGAVLPATKHIGWVAPTFADEDGGTAGYRPGLTGAYTLVDVPGAGVTVIWSWSANGKSPIPDDHQFIDGLSFG